jgi:hypothetical protein
MSALGRKQTFRDVRVMTPESGGQCVISCGLNAGKWTMVQRDFLPPRPSGSRER